MSMAQSIAVQKCAVNHCARLHVLESGGNRTQDRPVLVSTLQTVFVLMETSHHRDGGSLQRKCFIVGVLNFALFNIEAGTAARAKVLWQPGRNNVSGRRGGLWAAPRRRLSQLIFACAWEKSCNLGAEQSSIASHSRHSSPLQHTPDSAHPRTPVLSSLHSRSTPPPPPTLYLAAAPPRWTRSRSTSTATSTMSTASPRTRSRRPSPSRR